MTLCILTAGSGSRLNPLTNNINKALLPLQNKATISHIIEKTTGKIVIAVGYEKEKVIEYCLSAFPERKFVFIEVDDYSKGPGYSLLACENHLQEPFYLCTCDCIVLEEFPPINENWLGVAHCEDPKDFATTKIEENRVIEIKNKTLDGYKDAWIGLAGIHFYKTFWEQLKANSKDNYECVAAFYNPESYGTLHAKKFTWFDTGTIENYEKTKLHFPNDDFFDKNDQYTWFDNGYVIKYFSNSQITQDRIKRKEILGDLIPEISYKGKHIFSYKYIDAKTMYECLSLELFDKFLKWCKEKLWKPIETENIEEECLNFYKEKTYKRLVQCKDKEIYCFLERIDWKWLSSGVPSVIHGDLQFANILYNGNFTLIDWRENFGTNRIGGDVYYDLAKLNAGILVKINTLEKMDIKYKEFYDIWLVKNGFDVKKVNLLTILIYLNMSPLHKYPMSEMLMNYAKSLFICNF